MQTRQRHAGLPAEQETDRRRCRLRAAAPAERGIRRNPRVPLRDSPEGDLPRENGAGFDMGEGGFMKPYFSFQWHIADQCGQRCRHCCIYARNACRKPDSMSRVSDAGDFLQLP